MKIIYSISYKEILLKWRFHGKKNWIIIIRIFFKPALKFKKLRHDLWYGRAGGETDQRTTMTMRCASGWTARTTTTKQPPVYYSLSMLSLASLRVGRCLGCNVPTNFLFEYGRWKSPSWRCRCAGALRGTSVHSSCSPGHNLLNGFFTLMTLVLTLIFTRVY